MLMLSRTHQIVDLDVYSLQATHNAIVLNILNSQM